ncbi:MAG: hypothetical protein ACREYA_05115 [Cupriavidus necator]
MMRKRLGVKGKGEWWRACGVQARGGKVMSTLAARAALNSGAPAK